MSDKKFTVHVAHEKGHKQQLMAREDIVEMVSTNENTWVFVDSQMVSVEELENIELNDATEIRINPGMVGGSQTYLVMITDKHGHSEVQMTLDELKTEAKAPTNWVFIGPELVKESDLEKKINKAEESGEVTIRLTPQIVAGIERFIVETTNSDGHLQQALTKQEISNLATTDHWVFLDGQLVSADIIEATEFNQDVHVRYVRPLVGGL